MYSSKADRRLWQLVADRPWLGGAGTGYTSRVQDIVPELIKLAESGHPHQIHGCCQALGLINSAEALPVLVKQLDHPDRCVRYKAAEAIRKMDESAKPALEGILQALVATAEPSWPIRWEDPVQVAHGQLAAAVFSGPLKDELPKLIPSCATMPSAPSR